MAPTPFLTLPSSLKLPAGTSGQELLAIERAKASFNSDAMSVLIHGQEFLDRQAHFIELLEADPAFDKSDIHYLGRTEKFTKALTKDKHLALLQKQHGWSRYEADYAEKLCDLPGPFGLHKSMFITTLENMGTDEQREAFLGPAQNFEIIGCYAQTELQHGSNVQGLETTATYDSDAKEFILHSPNLGASKWWIGGLGRSATHAVVMARLLLPHGKKGQLKNYGPHPFVVQIRDVQTRKPLEGRLIGDIGPKFGYNTTDNGFLLLDKVRIPHFNQLARYASVDAETGEYKPPKSAALTYGTLTWVRANIVQESRSVMMRACTIAIRYCAIRRQFADRDAPQYDAAGKPIESQVLDYTMVQFRLFPVLAQAFAFHYTAKAMMTLYNENASNLQKGDLSLLADTHASSSGLKSLTTIMAADAIEQCRRACGGHGFSSSSGFTDFYTNFLPQVTWEGDSYMLSQQCSRYLLKMMRAVQKDPEGAENNLTTTYMKRYFKNREGRADFQFSGDLYDPSLFVNAFGHRAAFLTEQTLKLRDQERRSWNSILVELYKCSKAHAQFFLVKNFADAILKDDNLNSQPALRTIVQKVFLLFVCHTMSEEGADFLASGYITAPQYQLLSKKVQELLKEIRPQAVPLVDSFAVPDFLLNSSLGRSDGKVYEALFDFALKEPINKKMWNVSLHDSVTMMDDDEPNPNASKL